jgi:hypothetical protein
MTATGESCDPGEIKHIPSDRSFGFIFAAVWAIIAFWPLMKGGGPRLWTLSLAALFLLVAVVRPRLLQPLNRLWFKVGLVLHRVVTPIVMGVIFVLGSSPPR